MAMVTRSENRGRKNWLSFERSALGLALGLLIASSANATVVEQETTRSLNATRTTLQRIRTLLVNQGRAVSLGTLKQIEVVTRNAERLLVQDLRQPGGWEGEPVNFESSVQVGSRVLHLGYVEISAARVIAVTPNGRLTLRIVEGSHAGNVATDVSKNDVAATRGSLSSGLGVGDRVRQAGSQYSVGTVEGIQRNGRLVVNFDGSFDRLEKDWNARDLQQIHY